MRAVVVRFGPAVALFAAAKSVGWLSFYALLRTSGSYRFERPRYGGGHRPVDVLGSWDGYWYRLIAGVGYDPRIELRPGGGSFPGRSVMENSAAFFPSYPAAMRGLADVTGLSLFASGLVIAVLASLVAAAGIYAVVEHCAGRRAGIVAAGLWACMPGSGVLWAVYPESSYVALASWTCVAVIAGRWYVAGALALVAGLTHPTAGALIAAVGVTALVTMVRRRRVEAGPLTAMVLAPVGLVGFIAYVGLAAGRLDAYFVLQRDAWDQRFDGGLNTLRVIWSVLLSRTDYFAAQPVPDLIAVVVIAALPVLVLLLLRRRPPLVLVVFTVVGLLLMVLATGVFSSASRHTLTAFPLLVAPAAAARRLDRVTLAVLLLTAALFSGWYGGYALFQLGTP